MQLTCPKCGTREVRVSHRNGTLEQIKGVLGIYPLRCRRCRHRWLTSAWAGGAWRYARCPRCYRQELTTWSEQYYRPPRLVVMLLRLGAIPYRCAACRCNFASFKACKEKFSWRHELKGVPPAQDSAEITAVSEGSAARNGSAPYPAGHAIAPDDHGDLVSQTAVRTPAPETAAPEPVEEESSEPYL
jgi:hypothetical protein